MRCATAGALRALFRRLKFLRLLHTITPDGDGHRIVIDGPFSLFESVTKYGLQLALVLPALEECDAWRLEADVRWGKERAPLVFRLAGEARRGRRERAGASARRGRGARRGASGRSGHAVASLGEHARSSSFPGVGLCVPDLVFERRRHGAPRDRVYLEVMGYWSRAAVWKRVELVQAGLAERILFAVSSRLRVSEEVLDEELPGALYVYKETHERARDRRAPREARVDVRLTPGTCPGTARAGTRARRFFPQITLLSRGTTVAKGSVAGAIGETISSYAPPLQPSEACDEFQGT